MKIFKKEKAFLIAAAFGGAMFFAGCRANRIPAEALPSNCAKSAEVFAWRDGEKFRAAFPQTAEARLLLRAWEKTFDDCALAAEEKFSGNPIFSAGTLRAGFTETQTFFSVETETDARVFVRSGVAEDEFFRKFLLGLPFVPVEND